MIDFLIRMFLASWFFLSFQPLGTTEYTASTLQYNLQAKTESKFAVSEVVASRELAMLFFSVPTRRAR